MAGIIKGKIGLGLITCNAVDKFKQSSASVPEGVAVFVVVNDGEAYPPEVYPPAAHIIQHDRNYSVGKAKNDALHYLMDQGCEHLFLMEDDVIIQDAGVFDAYIQAAQRTGLGHLNYALQGPQNFKTTAPQSTAGDLSARHFDESSAEPQPTWLANYACGEKLAMYPACVGAFSYFHREVIEEAGYFDETFVNAWEHVEHTYRIILAGFHPPFWHFADIERSDRFLRNIPQAMERSTIARDPSWLSRSQKGEQYFKSLYGCIPAKLPRTKVRDCLQMLERVAAERGLADFPDGRSLVEIERKEKAKSYILASLQRKIAYPLAFKRLKASLKPETASSNFFFFFPFYHVGGAERVHIDILSTIAEQRPWIFFTGKSGNDAFLQEFKQQGIVFDMGYVRKKKYEQAALPLLAAKINASPNALVFGCNSEFFYKLLPLLAPEVRCIDLIHAFSDPGTEAAETWSIDLAERLEKRILISHKTIRDLQEQYVHHGKAKALAEHICYIPNSVQLQAQGDKAFSLPLRVLYVGRPSAEKRLHLVARIAKTCAERGLEVQVRCIGFDATAIDPAYRPFLEILGEQTNKQLLEEEYSLATALLITSSREGFPMVIMEAMSRGTIPIATAVGDIPYHIQHEQNGYLSQANEEALVVEEMVSAIQELLEDEPKRGALSKAAQDYAFAHFDRKSFTRAYRALLLGE